MATTFQPLYAANVALTWTSLASLAVSTYCTCAAVDNSSLKYADAMIYGHIHAGATPPAVNTVYNLYAYWSNDGGTTYTNNVGGTDATFTAPDSATDLPLLVSKVIGTATANATYQFKGISFCQAAGLLFLPQKWGLIFQNVATASASLNASGSAFSYQGVNMQGN